MATIHDSGEESYRWWPDGSGSQQQDEPAAGNAIHDNRELYERERDRVLYSDEFERLRGVTQVVSPTEGILCHDRHSHSLRVEQLAMRMASNGRLLASRPVGAPDEKPHAWVVAAAALAHDIGHPPFGHVAENELARLLTAAPFHDDDGYEGNAQSFRILVRLASHREGGRGLRLSRRVLRATLKYPWLKSQTPERYASKGKFGTYHDDAPALAFALGTDNHKEIGERSIDAAIMDAADSITYSVHDLIDFYRGGLIDVGRLSSLSDHQIREIADVKSAVTVEMLSATRGLLTPLSTWEKYDDSRATRELVQTYTSHLITTFVESHNLSWKPTEGWSLSTNDEVGFLLSFLQGLTRRYVIDSETMAATQIGHRRVIKRLFRMYVRALFRSEHRVFPSFFREEAKEMSGQLSAAIPAPVRKKLADGAAIEATEEHVLLKAAGRLAADVVASLTDSQALALNTRTLGLLPQDGFAGQRDA